MRVVAFIGGETLDGTASAELVTACHTARNRYPDASACGIAAAYRDAAGVWQLAPDTAEYRLRSDVRTVRLAEPT